MVAAVSLQAQLAETIEVRITNVDVVVTDKAGKPVTGLTKDDFEIVEAGKQQPITNFYEIRDAAADAVPAVEGQTAAPASVAEVPQEVTRRRIVVFVDNFTIHPLSRNQAFEAVEKSLDTLLRPGDEAMIVFWQGTTHDLAPFTADRAALISRFRAASKKSGGGMTLEAMRSQIIEHASQMIADANSPARRKITHADAYSISLQNSRAFAENLYSVQNNLMDGLERTLSTLAGVPGKKALIFIGAELADTPGLELFHQIDGMYQQYIRDIRPAVLRESGRTLGAELRKVAQRANANGVTMYLVDAADRSRRSDPTEHMIDPGAAFVSETNTPMAMSTVAAITGGISVPGGRNFEKALGTIARDLSSYYSLGYRSPEGGEGNRRFQVRVKKPGLRVRSRSSYVARSGEDEIRDRVIANVFHDDVKSDFPIRVDAAAPEATDGGRFKVKLTITIPSTLTLIEQDDQLAGEFAVFFATGRPDGALSTVSKSVQAMKFPGDAREQVEAQKTFNYTATLLMQPGEQFVSVGVSDTLAGTAGFGRTKVTAQ
ncbi:MAG TPA: VWA domain-containing protein [Thermoanaerobaculia bacterium]|nr:VWA domain-containing protein [Thermoanaerobaculia bacterium]